MNLPSGVIKEPAKMVDTLEIESKSILIVEGKDEVYFFEELFKSMNLQEDIQLIDIGGVDQIKSKMKVIVNMPNFEQVTSFGIIRDSDGDSNGAVQSVQDILRNVDLPIPSAHSTFSDQMDGIKVGMYVMPGSTVEGEMLEDLCLQTIKDSETLVLIDKYLVELEGCDTTFPRNKSKAKCLIYLASMDKVVNNIGLGAKKRYWDFNSEALNELKAFIKEFISQK